MCLKKIIMRWSHIVFKDCLSNSQTWGFPLLTKVIKPVNELFTSLPEQLLHYQHWTTVLWVAEISLVVFKLRNWSVHFVAVSRARRGAADETGGRPRQSDASVLLTRLYCIINSINYPVVQLATVITNLPESLYKHSRPSFAGHTSRGASGISYIEYIIRTQVTAFRASDSLI